jgi:osmoprotectant transport system ATP-binding protein
VIEVSETMIDVSRLTKRFGAHVAVDRVSFDVREGECCVLLGPSGCGKSTTLRAINRLVEPDDGVIKVRGRDVREYRPEELRRSMGYVVQSVGLFPHMTVARNIAIVPRLCGWDRRRIDERIDELLDLVGLEPASYRNRYPSQLSGGEAQRVGVARALAADPPILLMDEPFGALDPITRKKLQNEFADLKRKVRKTIVFVTHDIYEAVILGDRIVLLNEGRLEQHAAPEEIWKNPASEFVQRFVGSEFGLLVLSRHSVTELLLARNGEENAAGIPAIEATWTLKDAVSEMIRTRSRALVVRAADGTIAGTVTFDSIVDFIRNGEQNER